MPLEIELIKTFIQYLKDNGYPEESIGIEYIVNKNYRIDIAILDQKQNIPIQIFEVKTNKNKRSIENGKMQLERCRSLLKDNNIPAYIVFSKSEPPYFEVINIDKISDEDFIIFDYKSHRNKRLYEVAENVKKEKEKVIDSFKILFYVLSIIVFCIGVLSKIGFFKISIEDLTIIAFSIGLLLIPYASKIKILGIEFERLTGNKEK